MDVIKWMGYEWKKVLWLSVFVFLFWTCCGAVESVLVLVLMFPLGVKHRAGGTTVDELVYSHFDKCEYPEECFESLGFFKLRAMPLVVFNKWRCLVEKATALSAMMLVLEGPTSLLQVEFRKYTFPLSLRKLHEEMDTVVLDWCK